MATFSFNPIAESLTVKFYCPFCSSLEKTDEIFIPIPDMLAETHRESVSSESYEYYCSKCDNQFSISLHNGYYGGCGDISDVSEIISVEEKYDNDSEWEYEMFEDHVRDIVKTLDSINNLSPFVKRILYKNLYANLIAILEAYLCDNLLRCIMQSEENKRKFIENYKEFDKIKISLTDLYRKLDNIDSLIANTVKNLVYHNLSKIKGIYKDSIGVDLGDISTLCKSISIRHDIVHRNGKDMQSNQRLFEESEVRELAEHISNFIKNIEDQLKFVGLVEGSPFD